MKIAQIRKFALALDAVTEQPHHAFSSLRVRGKIFVTIPPDEQHIHLFVPVDAQDEAVSTFPSFVEKLSWGSRTIGVRVSLKTAKPSAVLSLVLKAYDATVAKESRPKQRRAAAKPKGSQSRAVEGPPRSRST